MFDGMCYNVDWMFEECVLCKSWRVVMVSVSYDTW